MTDDLQQQLDTRALIDHYYTLPEGGGGGACHIALEDPNYDDDDLRWCENYAREKGDKIGELIAQRLLAMPYGYRREFLGWTLRNGYADDLEEDYFRSNPAECPHNWAGSMTQLDGTTHCMGCGTQLESRATGAWTTSELHRACTCEGRYAISVQGQDPHCTTCGGVSISAYAENTEPPTNPAGKP